MAFDIVGDYIDDSRTLLQDQVVPYRYSTSDLINALNLTIMDVRRLRPDLLIDYLDNVPQYEWNDAISNLVPGVDANFDDDDNPTWTMWVPIEQAFRRAIVFGIVGHAMQRDQEDIEDERALARLMTFENILTEAKSTKGMAAPKG
jgi:hypothetical protein